jgi:hypothetical protein
MLLSILLVAAPQFWQKLHWARGDTHMQSGCPDCHSPDTHTSPVFDRLILVDPCDVDGQPVYQTVREMTGLNPP